MLFFENMLLFTISHTSTFTDPKSINHKQQAISVQLQKCQRPTAMAQQLDRNGAPSGTKLHFVRSSPGEPWRVIPNEPRRPAAPQPQQQQQQQQRPTTHVRRRRAPPRTISPPPVVVAVDSVVSSPPHKQRRHQHQHQRQFSPSRTFLRHRYVEHQFADPTHRPTRVRFGITYAVITPSTATTVATTATAAATPRRTTLRAATIVSSSNISDGNNNETPIVSYKALPPRTPTSLRIKKIYHRRINRALLSR